MLCTIGAGEGYEELLARTIVLASGSMRLRALTLEKLIDVKTRAGRAKDFAVLPVLAATLDEQRKKSGV